MKQKMQFMFVLGAILIQLLNVSNASDLVYKVNVVTEYLEPYQIKNADGTLGGVTAEIVEAMFKEANSEANTTVMPWARAYEYALLTPNTLIYSMAHTKNRDKLFHWVGSIKEERLYFWGLKSKFSYPIKKIAELKPFKIAASRQSNVANYLNDNEFSNIHELIKEDQNMLMLYRGRVDLIVATELTLINRAKKLGLDFAKLAKIKEVKELNNDLSIAFNIDSDPKMVKHFQQAFSTLEQSGELLRIQKKWHLIK